MRDREFSSNLPLRICGKCPRILFESRAFEGLRKIFWDSVLGSFKDLGSWKKYVVRRKIASTEKHYADLENISKVSLYDLGYLSRIVHFMISHIICESRGMFIFIYFFLFFFHIVIIIAIHLEEKNKREMNICVSISIHYSLFSNISFQYWNIRNLWLIVS